MDYIKEQIVTRTARIYPLYFNPCCDGLYKRTQTALETCITYPGFNPCCDGLYKRTNECTRTSQKICFRVSILVVMDYIKELLNGHNLQKLKYRFNPCCDGLYKRTIRG